METQICFKENRRDCFAKSVLLIIVLFFFLHGADCQEAKISAPDTIGGSYENTFSTSRIGMAQSVMTTPRGEFHFVVSGEL